MKESSHMNREYDLSKKLLKNVSIGAMFVVSGCCVMLSSCIYAPPQNPNRPVHEIKAAQNLDAAKFNKEFALAVTEADVVVVREHSHSSDLNSSLVARNKISEYTYIKKELNFNERMTFVKEVNALKGRARNITTDCLFVPHHSVELYKNGNLSSVMEICYNCGEIKWNGSKLKASGDMFDAVTPLLKRSGMKVHRDWHSKAEDKFVSGQLEVNEGSSAVDSNQNTAESRQDRPPVIVGGIPTAKWILNQEGKKVTNPFTGGSVDVEGIPAGTKVRDPNDKNEAHIFRVPAL